MSELRAALHASYGQPDIIVRAAGVSATLAAWLPDYFVEEARRGVRFAPDQTLQIGWSVLKLYADAAGDLVVFEPDFASMPIKWIEGVSQCVRFLALQQAVCEELGVEPDFPSLAQSAFAPDPLPRAGDFTMSRAEEENRHSGWLLQPEGEAALQVVSLYQAALSNRAIIPFLALPSGSAVKRERGRYSISINGRDTPAPSSELLTRLSEAGAFS
jgi:hypothetical protein